MQKDGQFFHSEEKEEENWRCPQLADHSEIKSRGEEIPEKRYKLPGHILFQQPMLEFEGVQWVST